MFLPTLSGVNFPTLSQTHQCTWGERLSSQFAGLPLLLEWPLASVGASERAVDVGQSRPPGPLPSLPCLREPAPAKRACELWRGVGREALTSWLYLPRTKSLRPRGGIGEMLAAWACLRDAPALDCDLGHPLRERGDSLLLNQREGEVVWLKSEMEIFLNVSSFVVCP